MKITMLRTLAAVLGAAALIGCGEDSNDAASGGTGGSVGSGATGGISATGGSSGATTGGTGGGNVGGGGGAAGMPGTAGNGGVSACDLTVPTTYDGTNYETNAAAELALRAQLKALSDAMRTAELSTDTTFTTEELEALFDAGDPSLSDVMTSYHAGVVQTVFGEFADASGDTWDPASAPTGVGGIWGEGTNAWIFSERGTDLRQVMEKGSFGSVFYNHALTLIESEITEATIDRLVAAFGAHPSFPSDSSTAVANPDVYSAQYAERRDAKNPEQPGFYARSKLNLIEAKTAIAVNNTECRDQALAEFFADWEKSNYATVIHYANDAYTKLSAAEPTLAQQSSALHVLGEALGLARGFRTVPEDDKIISDVQIDALLTLFNAPNGGDVTTYRFLTDTASELSKLQQIIDSIQGVYGFSNQEVESFKTAY